MPRSALLRVTGAPETAAPLGSVTVPVTDPVSWPNAVNESVRTMLNHNARDFIADPLKNCLKPVLSFKECGHRSSIAGTGLTSNPSSSRRPVPGPYHARTRPVNLLYVVRTFSPARNIFSVSSKGLGSHATFLEKWFIKTYQ